jgi:hypothetical protein
MKSMATLLASWAAEIANSSNRVRNLIGDAHWLTDGTHKENLIREFIRPRLPPGIQGTHGFLLSPSAELHCSPEIDVLIRDCSSSCAYFDEGGITICDAIAALAYWQVKSQFSASSLSDALDHVRLVQQVIAPDDRKTKVWSGVCFIDCPDSRTDESILSTVGEQVRNLMRANSERDSGHLVDMFPTCIVALNRFAIFIDIPSTGSGCRLRYFPTAELSFSIAVADMLSHVYAQTSVRVMQPLDRVLEDIVQTAPTILEVAP